MQNLRKFWVAAAGSVGAVVLAFFPHLSGLWPAIVAIVTAAVVYLVPNAKPADPGPRISSVPPPELS